MLSIRSSPRKLSEVPSWILLIVGVFIGQSSSSYTTPFLQWIQDTAESVLVPAYTLSVLLYLSAAAYSKYFAPLITGRKQPPTGPVTSSIAPIPEAYLEEEDNEPQPVNLTGAYKLRSNDGFEKLLEVQGVPWALRRYVMYSYLVCLFVVSVSTLTCVLDVILAHCCALSFINTHNNRAANQARPTHRLTHTGRRLVIKIEGIIESQTTYLIGGPPTRCNVRGRIFEDTVKYLENEKGIFVNKHAVTEDYDVTVQRELADDRQSICMTSTAIFPDDRPSVKCVQQFQRIE